MVTLLYHSQDTNTAPIDKVYSHAIRTGNHNTQIQTHRILRDACIKMRTQLTQAQHTHMYTCLLEIHPLRGKHHTYVCVYLC